MVWHPGPVITNKTDRTSQVSSKDTLIDIHGDMYVSDQVSTSVDKYILSHMSSAFEAKVIT